MREKWLFSDNQDFDDEDSTGTISTNIWDLEYDNGDNLIVVDQGQVGYLNGVINTYGYTSGGTEGLIVGLRTDDAVSLDTARSDSAGYDDICMKAILLQYIVAGYAFSVPFVCDRLKRYLGAWVSAASTTFATTVLTIELWFENTPITQRRLQKRPA